MNEAFHRSEAAFTSALKMIHPYPGQPVRCWRWHVLWFDKNLNQTVGCKGKEPDGAQFLARNNLENLEYLTFSQAYKRLAGRIYCFSSVTSTKDRQRQPCSSLPVFPFYKVPIHRAQPLLHSEQKWGVKIHVNLLRYWIPPDKCRL